MSHNIYKLLTLKPLYLDNITQKFDATYVILH